MGKMAKKQCAKVTYGYTSVSAKAGELREHALRILPTAVQLGERAGKYAGAHP